MTQQPEISKLLHPAHPAGSARRSLALVTSEPDLPQPPSSPTDRVGTASAPAPTTPSGPAEAGAGAVTRRHLTLVTHPFQGAPE
ncbi:hypothetical protein KSP35_17935 [Aquihabitans sp. G128]|uniref:hypothetical protein n=1 Tax=Aquihabitans sp. G128 TaxID=2849779 RepID=UPI001C2192A4|nr:hypothetical protein [Aquihabitans sp. G128]QXC60209.1 hypothetical protein KSP35_17935 [Aquihabitans sp. G128]